MNDKQLAALFRTQLLPLMQATPELSGVGLARKYQSRQQGAYNAPYVYFVKIGDHRYGHPSRKERFRPDTSDFAHVETQKYETTFQFMAWAQQNPVDVTALTESDILNIVCGLLQSDEIRRAFGAQGVGILRVTEVRNPYIVDDRDQFEATPNFDIVLTHDRTRVTTSPAVVTYQAKIGRV